LSELSKKVSHVTVVKLIVGYFHFMPTNLANFGCKPHSILKILHQHRNMTLNNLSDNGTTKIENMAAIRIFPSNSQASTKQIPSAIPILTTVALND